MTDFWIESGYKLLDRSLDGNLLVTDDFFRAYLMRPEMEPVEESCEAECSLHARLIKNPRAVITATDIAEMADQDIQENYHVMINFRNYLINCNSIEKGYLDFFRNKQSIQIPPLFLNQLTQVILRNILNETHASPLFYRDKTHQKGGGSRHT